LWLAWRSLRTTEHVVSEGMPHGYYFFPGLFKQGDEAFAAISRFLRRSVPPRPSA
jgi:hypothetical protein